MASRWRRRRQSLALAVSSESHCLARRGSSSRRWLVARRRGGAAFVSLVVLVSVGVVSGVASWRRQRWRSSSVGVASSWR
ncbi:hypothetical protein ACXZ9C_11010 [Streptococcus agalactiae]